MDAYDAMTTDRPYREAMSFEEAQAILRDGGGSQWDPAIVNLFLEMLRVRPELQEDASGDHDSLVLPEHAHSHHRSPEEITG
jgi:HD-GYP domain-containing protein (c-di-GMP phosphodiesterase class II)